MRASGLEEAVRRGIRRVFLQPPPTEGPPVAELARVLAMAEEMGYCNSYGEYDEDGEYLGVAPDVQRDRAAVREWLRLPKKDLR